MRLVSVPFLTHLALDALFVPSVQSDRLTRIMCVAACAWPLPQINGETDGNSAMTDDGAMARGDATGEGVDPSLARTVIRTTAQCRWLTTTCRRTTSSVTSKRVKNCQPLAQFGGTRYVLHGDGEINRTDCSAAETAKTTDHGPRGRDFSSRDPVAGPQNAPSSPIQTATTMSGSLRLAFSSVWACPGSLYQASPVSNRSGSSPARVRVAVPSTT